MSNSNFNQEVESQTLNKKTMMNKMQIKLKMWAKKYGQKRR